MTIKGIKIHIKQIFEEEMPKEYVFHDHLHTISMSDHAMEIAEAEGLDQEDKDLLEAATLFHDIGYVKTYKEHEVAGADMAAEYLKNKGFSNDKIEQVRAMIMSTKMPPAPKTLMQRIICDADSYHLGTDQFVGRSELLRTEWAVACEKKFTEEEWVEENIGFLQTHQYFTSYARNTLTTQKEKSLSRLKKQQKEFEKERERKEKANRPDRGVETMMRNTLRGHLNLSAIADRKAGVMLSVNSIIISVAFAGLVPRFHKDPELIVPTFILLAVNLITIAYAVKAVIPNVTKGKFSRDDIKNKTANLLFFGNFHKMDQDEFVWGMNQMMKDKEFLYNAMIRDFYFLGKVLNRKYMLLRTCYRVFMMGLFIAILAFIVAISYEEMGWLLS